MSAPTLSKRSTTALGALAGIVAAIAALGLAELIAGIRQQWRSPVIDAVLADQELLTSILSHHVVAGERLDAAALGEAGTAATVNGAELGFGADGTTANATVHVIDAVLTP